jgi:hypothetical protein
MGLRSRAGEDPMKALASKDIETNARYQLQNAYLAIRDSGRVNLRETAEFCI